MGIVDEDVARVRAASDFHAIASERMALKKSGVSQFVGLCPFHAENSPSFSINVEKGVYWCFGCQARGDVISFVRETEHLDFVAAVEKLAARANITLRYDNEAAGRDRQRRDVLIDAMEKAVDWYHDRLLNADDAGPARGYLRGRGYDKEIVEQFKIGFAPDDWDALSKALALPEKVLTDTGLGFLNRRNRQQDSFRARVMFPIYDTAGKPVAFGGRVLPGSTDPAKYKNSPETPIYSKRRVLYGLNWAKADASSSGEVVVCEGYTDVIAFFLAGAPRAVATCGTAVTEEHLRVLRPFAKRIVLAYDSDAAGQNAAERFYEWERELELQLAVLDLRSGTDPADLARRDPAALRAALTDARSFLDFRVERALGAADLQTLEGRAKAAELALGMIAQHPSQLVKDQYLGKVAARVDIPAEQLARSIRGSGTRAVVRPVSVSRPTVLDDGPETEALRVAIHRPEDVAGLLHEALFREPAHHAAYLALEGGDPLMDVIENASPDAAALLSRLAIADTEADADEVVARVVRVAAERELARLNASMADGADHAEVAPLVNWLATQRELLSDQQEPETRRGAIEALVAWLALQVDGGEVA